MPRFKLTLEYDGAPYVGWQRQENGVSVQERLEDAIFAMTGERALVHGAGRTDAGVHATGQVAHVDLSRDWAPFRLSEGLNAHLVPASALLPNRNGEAMTRSNVTQRLAIAVRAAAKDNPTLTNRPISPHTIRHYVPRQTISSSGVKHLILRQVRVIDST